MSLSDLGAAPIAVNGYLWDTMKAIDPTLQNKYKSKIPIFPLSDQASGNKAWENKPYIIYDRMFKLGGGPFYPKKKEQILYYVKGNEEDTIYWGAALQMILDRGDDAGKDINNWIRNNGGNAEYPLFFHYLRIYQTDSSISSSSEMKRDFSTRSYYITEFVIDMCYHYTTSLEDYL
jgi:hypothetical protein